jgi:hypothetical protein
MRPARVDSMWRRKEAVDERMAKRGEVGEGTIYSFFVRHRNYIGFAGGLSKPYGFERSRAGLKQIPYVRSLFILLR